MLRPLTNATAPPRRSATRPNRVLRSASANVSNGESVNSIRVPSTSKNKHHSSDGGGSVCINIAYSIDVAYGSPLIPWQCNIYTNILWESRDWFMEFRYFAVDVSLNHVALRAAGGF